MFDRSAMARFYTLVGLVGRLGRKELVNIVCGCEGFDDKVRGMGGNGKGKNPSEGEKAKANVKVYTLRMKMRMR